MSRSSRSRLSLFTDSQLEGCSDRVELPARGALPLGGGLWEGSSGGLLPSTSSCVPSMELLGLLPEALENTPETLAARRVGVRLTEICAADVVSCLFDTLQQATCKMRAASSLVK